MTFRRLLCPGLLLLPCLLLGSAQAAGSDRYKVGITKVSPRSKATDFVGSFTPPGLSLKIESFTALTFSYYRSLGERFELELAAGIPPTADVSARVNNPGLPDDIRATNGQVAARLKLYTPTVYLNYRFGKPKSRWQPYVGLGLNYVVSKGTSTPVNETLNLGPTDILVGNSIGAAAQFGMDYWFNDDIALSVGLAMWRNKAKITFVSTNVADPIDLRLARSSSVTTSPLLLSFSLSGRF
jgi:outer membrane protein